MKASVTKSRRASSLGSTGSGSPACTKWVPAAVSSPSLQHFAARSTLPSTEGEIALP
jgi:hypothetical protein